MMDYLDLIRTAASIISAGGIVIAAYQFSLQRKVWLASHERSRREKAIEIMREFNKSLNAETAATYKIVERLDDDQCRDLDTGLPIKIAARSENDIRAALPSDTLDVECGFISLTGAQSYRLRFQALETLNAAEIACQAWLKDVADRQIIEDELRFLYHRNNNRPTTMMEKFRNLTDGKVHYPALTEFLDHMDNMSARSKPAPEARITPSFKSS